MRLLLAAVSGAILLVQFGFPGPLMAEIPAPACDGLSCGDLPTDACLPGGHRVTLIDFVRRDGVGSKNTFIYELCSPFEGVCSGAPNVSCLDNTECGASGPCIRDCAADDFQDPTELLIQVPSASDPCLSSESLATGGTCSCSGIAGVDCQVDSDIVVMEDDCPVADGTVATCGINTLVPGECMEMTLQVPGSVDLGLGGANSTTACDEGCIATPSCNGACDCPCYDLRHVVGVAPEFCADLDLSGSESYTATLSIADSLFVDVYRPLLCRAFSPEIPGGGLARSTTPAQAEDCRDALQIQADFNGATCGPP